jgi:transcriptional regulator with XRE-family HTH domain
MRGTDTLGKILRTRCEDLRLSQRQLGYKIGADTSYVALIESSRRKPSLKPLARMGDVLCLERQGLLFLAHPEAEALIAEPPLQALKKTTSSWQRFIRGQRF